MDRSGKSPKSITDDLFCLVGGYEMHGVAFEDGEEETYVKANITPVYADMLKNSDLNPFERRMLDSSPTISRRWYEVIRMWRFFRSKTRNNVSIKYFELCDWIPIDWAESAEMAMELMARIHAPFIECGFIKDIETKFIKRKSKKDWVFRYMLYSQDETDYSTPLVNSKNSENPYMKPEEHNSYMLTDKEPR